ARQTMPTCPDGHQSSSTDFCDTCGMRIEGAPAAPPAPASGSAAPAGGASSSGESCPVCGSDRTGMFCEVCGYDYAAGTPAAPVDPASVFGGQPDPGLPPQSDPGAANGWGATVSADRAYFDSVVEAGGPDAAAIEFPAYCPERRFSLNGQEMRIGRRSPSRGLEPEIDLAGPPTDPGISHLHAVLIAQPDGTWSVLDPGSSNGTQVNGNEIVTGVP